MACGTGLVFQSAKLVTAIGPMLGFGGGCVNTRVFRASLASNPVGFATLGSSWVAIMFSRIAGSASVRLRLMEPGSR